MDFGHLVNSENFNIRNFHPDLWQMFDNRWDWERAYLHENYSQSLNESNKIQMVSNNLLCSILRFSVIN